MLACVDGIVAYDPARAQPDERPPDESSDARPRRDDVVTDAPEASTSEPTPGAPPSYHWDRGRPRLMIAARLDAGFLARAQVHVGYGRPFWLWAGVEAHAFTTSEFGAFYVGARASSPVLELTVGARFDVAYRRGPLTPAARYDDGDLASSQAPSRYRAIDVDLYGVVPLGRVLVGLEFAVTHLPDAAPRYDEWHRVIITGRTLFATRVAPLVALDARRRHRLGMLGEWIRDRGREASTFRVGPAYQFAISPKVDLYIVGSLAPVSPDRLSAWNDLYGTGSIRYRWASGDPSPPRIRDARPR